MLVAVNIQEPQARKGETVFIREATIALEIADLAAFVKALDRKRRGELIRAVAEIAASDIIEALEDKSLPLVGGTPQLGARGTTLMDCFVERAKELDRLPDDYESEWTIEFKLAGAQLQRRIAERDTDAALGLLAELVPGLLSPAAAKMVGGFTGETLL